MPQPVEKRSTCLSPLPVSSTDFANLGLHSDWWKRANSAQAATTPRDWSEGTVGLELVQICRPAAHSAKVTFVIAEGDVIDAAYVWDPPSATMSGMAWRLMPESWVADELELDLGSVLYAAVKRRLRDLVSVGEDEETGLEQEVTVRTNFDEADEVRRTLAVTWSQLESITGISEQTFYYWKRNQRTARPSTVRKLRRLLALVRAVGRQRGVDEAAEWFQTGAPSPIELMIGGQLEAVEAQVGMMLPSAIASGTSSIDAIGAEAEHTPLIKQPSSGQPKAMTRPRHRSHVPNRDR